MHELSLCEEIRNILCSEAEKHNLDRIRVVHLRIGALSCVEIEALRFCFKPVMVGSIAEGAALEICQVPAKAKCHVCDDTYDVAARWEACPLCGTASGNIIYGDEMHVARIEADEAMSACGRTPHQIRRLA